MKLIAWNFFCSNSKSIQLVKWHWKSYVSQSPYRLNYQYWRQVCRPSSMLHTRETWVFTKDSEREGLTFERKCYRKTKRIRQQLKVQRKRNRSNTAEIATVRTYTQSEWQWKDQIVGFWFGIMIMDRKSRTTKLGWWHRRLAQRQELNYSSQDRTKWKQVEASASNGRWAKGLWWKWW